MEWFKLNRAGWDRSECHGWMPTLTFSRTHPNSLPQGAAADPASPHLPAGGPVSGVPVVYGSGHGHLPAQVPGAPVFHHSILRQHAHWLLLRTISHCRLHPGGCLGQAPPPERHALQCPLPAGDAVLPTSQPAPLLHGLPYSPDRGHYPPAWVSMRKRVSKSIAEGGPD